MSVAAILAAFRQAAFTGRIDGATMPLLGELVETLGVDHLPLTDGDARPVGATAVLTGQTSWRNTAWSLKIVGDTSAGDDHLALTLQATPTATPWTLGQAFPDMPPSRVLSATAGGVLELVPSVLAPLAVDQPQALAEATEGLAEQPSARLQGWLRLEGILAPYAVPLGSARAWLDGPMVFAAPDHADLDLIAATPGADGVIPGIDVGRLDLRLTTAYPDPYTFEVIPPATSMVELLVSVDLGGRSSNVVVVRSPLLQTGQVWPLEARIDPPLTLVDGVASLVSMIDGSRPADFQLPAGLAPLDAFGLSELNFGVTPWDADPALRLVYTGLTVESTTAWDVPVPFVMVENVGTTWMLNWAGPAAVVTGSIWGTMAFGAKSGSSLGATPTSLARAPAIRGEPTLDDNGDPIRLYVQVDLPSLDIYAETRSAITLSLSSAMSAYFPGPQPDVPIGIVVEKISVTASMYTQAYGATLIASGTWPITIGNVAFSLENIFFEVAVTQSTVSGSLQGFVGVSVNGEQKALFNAAAIYPGDGTWTFNAGLVDGELNLTEFAFAFLGETPPDWLPDIVLTKLWMSYSTAAGNPYGAGAALAVRWDPAVLGLTLSLEAEAEIRYYAVASVAGQMDRAALTRKRAGPALVEPLPGGPLQLPVLQDGDPPPMTYAGSVKGRFELNRLMITVGMSFVSSEQTYLFGLQLERFALTARTSWIGAGAKRHQVLTVEMAGATLGEMVESFARLANPNINYRLEAPWTFLNKIDLGRFTLVLDPSEQSVTLDYRLNLELGFITITSVGLRYQRDTGEPQVLFEITGRFLGKTYDRSGAPGTEPLSWDAVNDSPPAVPGKGPSLVDLRYMGFGQHVDLTGLTRPDSMAEIISLMKQQMRPVADSRVNPLKQPSGDQMVFNEASQWLIGLDVTLMGTVSVSLVMHDPDLYGVLIALAGPDSGSLAGFSFELIYKKVTDDVGVFHVRLQVPDAFRQLDFGVVQISLGIITVDIFTNGNFLIDLGFPHDRDFSLSFGVTYGIFMGRGGIYFGLLDGATSKRVPAITNGTFDPVLELGVGLAVGVGRTFNKGPLKAGLYVEVEVIFEGVLAWFHPDDAAKPSAMYYWARGTAALVGRLYGSVDFKVISVDVNVEAFAAVTLTLAAHQPTLIEMKVGVRVKASVKILFVRVSFSFGMTIEASFTIGTASSTPWVLGADQSGRSLTDQRFTAFAPPRRRPTDVRRQSRLARLTARRGGGLRGLSAARVGQDAVGPGDVYDLVWDPTRKLFPDGQVHDVVLKMLPAFTVADVPVAWSGPTPPPNPNPAWRIDFILMADSAVPVDASNIAGTHRLTADASAQAGTVEETAFNTLVEAMLRWAVSALPDVSGPVTMGDLADLATQLDWPQTLDQGFGFETLSTLFTNNLLFKLGGRPGGNPADQSGVAFPMPPILNWTSPDLPVEAERTRDFAVYQPIDAVYQAGVAAYFADLDARTREHQPNLAAISDEEAGQSMASFVFRDYMALIAKTTVQAAETLLDAWPWPLSGSETLAGIAGSFPTVALPYVKQAGDTVEQVAASLGMSTSEILALNPDLVVTLAAATPGQVIEVNQGVTPESLAAGNPDRVLAEGKVIPVAVLPTQARLAETLSGVAARLHGDLAAWMRTAALLDQPGLLRPGAPLMLAGLEYANPGGLDLRSVAAVFFARLPVGVEFPHADWYAEAIVQLNGDKIGADGGLPPQVVVPAAYDDTTNTATWTTLPGDSLAGLSRTLTLIQNLAPGSAFELYLAQVTALNPVPGATPVRLPDASCPVVPDETLRGLATRLLLVDPATTPFVPTAAFDGFVTGADILQPLAAVSMINARLPTTEGQTLAAFAAQYDLTVLDVGRLGAGVAGLIAPVADKPLIVPAVPAIELDALVARILTGEPAATIAGQVSRFMLHGQRIPAPVESGGHYEATGPLTGLYDLIGQQVTGPAPDPALPPETVRAQVTVALDTATPWLVFVDSAAAEPDDTVQTLAARHPDLARLNPALDENRLQPGMVVLTGETDSLVFNITEAELAAGYPDTGLAPQFEGGGLAALTLYRDDPVRHALTETRRWQTPTQPNLPAFSGPPSAGMPSLWPLTGDLLAKAALNADTDWNLKRTDPELGPEAAPLPVQNYVWASQIDLRIQRVPGRPNTYELFGADTAGRQRLLEAWRYLADNPATDGAQLTLLYQLSQAAGLPPGLTSGPIDPARTYLVKTNLSTETRSGVSARARGAGDDPPSFGDYYAAISDTTRFLTLLWEASVVGGGGYWLEITAPDGSGLPEQIFGSEGGGLLTLMIVLDSQSSATPSRKLVSFNTCALVADPIDASATALFVEAADRAELVRQSTVRPGEVGFELYLTAETGDAGQTTPQDRLRDLYSLLGYQLLETEAFVGSGQGKPIGPLVEPGSDETVWRLSQIVPTRNFASTNPLPAVEGLPDPASDPYAGVSPGGEDPVMVHTTVAVWFRDVFGNSSASGLTGETA